VLVGDRSLLAALLADDEVFIPVVHGDAGSEGGLGLLILLIALTAKLELRDRKGDRLMLVPQLHNFIINRMVCPIPTA
jgi:hypothetical protein